MADYNELDEVIEVGARLVVLWTVIAVVATVIERLTDDAVWDTFTKASWLFWVFGVVTWFAITLLDAWLPFKAEARVVDDPEATDD